jgi:hypothetical protein
MCEGNAPDAKLQQLSYCVHKLGDRTASSGWAPGPAPVQLMDDWPPRRTAGSYSLEEQTGVCCPTSSRACSAPAPCINHWSTTTTTADELTQLSTQLVLDKTVLLDYQNDRAEARRLTTISGGRVLLALPMLLQVPAQRSFKNRLLFPCARIASALTTGAREAGRRPRCRPPQTPPTRSHLPPSRKVAAHRRSCRRPTCSTSLTLCSCSKCSKRRALQGLTGTIVLFGTCTSHEHRQQPKHEHSSQPRVPRLRTS